MIHLCTKFSFLFFIWNSSLLIISYYDMHIVFFKLSCMQKESNHAYLQHFLKLYTLGIMMFCLHAIKHCFWTLVYNLHVPNLNNKLFCLNLFA